AQLLVRRRKPADPVESLTPREREVLALMAEGRANGDIATHMTITERAVHKHVGNIFAKLDLPPSDSGHRRVLAVLAYLNH
ncbi:response regulator transcription factor, partial [Kibdelosporangium lantanae]